MSWIDEPILRALRVRKQGYRLAMAAVCIPAGTFMMLVPWLFVPGAIVAAVGCIKLANWATSSDSPEDRYGD